MAPASYRQVVTCVCVCVCVCVWYCRRICKERLVCLPSTFLSDGVCLCGVQVCHRYIPPVHVSSMLCVHTCMPNVGDVVLPLCCSSLPLLSMPDRWLEYRADRTAALCSKRYAEGGVEMVTKYLQLELLTDRLWMWVWQPTLVWCTGLVYYSYY